ncbi:AAA family ATPase [Campylobacter ureolyticus]|uniref:AAA family ATPase n=1 Tax=Campylobacter ureolyticus TaxID=827 RepID=UPI0022B46341|nr:AAA family ATPase [Campylobacter ureolyticus]MCZ6157653.1 AAA family ATPase [Campylobacter ureolyticus]MCZ6168411.1 AAA family ATPase [Campylobacter ureolyticus]
MKINIKNIGIVKEADIEINGITVLAGENSTGKSTISKALFSTFNGLYNIDKKIENDKLRTIKGVLGLITMSEYRNLIVHGLSLSKFDILMNELVEKIIKNQITEKNELKKILSDLITTEKKSNIFKKIIDNISDVMNLDNNSYKNTILEEQFNKEFDNQISNIRNNDNAKIVVSFSQNKNKNIDISIISNKINIKEHADIITQVIYIDDINMALEYKKEADIFRIYNLGEPFSHTTLLVKLLDDKNPSLAKKIINEKKLENINKILNQISPGMLYTKDDGNFVYKTEDGIDISTSNISLGLKTFIVLKKLIQNSTIEENGTIILDEPEIHLHPKNQLKFAEIIVLLQKEFELHILLSTHSPYFIKAIEEYSKKYAINKKCKFYLSSLKNKVAIFEDVTEKTYKIYKLLAEPYDILDEIEKENNNRDKND